MCTQGAAGAAAEVAPAIVKTDASLNLDIEHQSIELCTSPRTLRHAAPEWLQYNRQTKDQRVDLENLWWRYRWEQEQCHPRISFKEKLVVLQSTGSSR